MKQLIGLSNSQVEEIIKENPLQKVSFLCKICSLNKEVVTVFKDNKVFFTLDKVSMESFIYKNGETLPLFPFSKYRYTLLKEIEA
jgi:hypothetical protein